MTYPPPPPGDWGGQQPPDGGYGQPPYDPYQYPDNQPQVDPYSAPPQPSSGSPYMQPMPPDYSQPMSGMPASGQPWPTPMPAPQPSGGQPVWLFIVGGIVLLVMIGGGVFLAINGVSGDEPNPDPTASASSSTGSEPASDLISDSATGLSFPPIDSWGDEKDTTPITPGFSSSTGQMYEVEPGWVAMMSVGEIDAASAKYEGADSAEDAINELADQLEKANYYSPTGSEPLKGLKRDQDVTTEEFSTDGKDGLLGVFHLKWDDESLKSQGETLTVGVIDLGGGSAAGFVATLPDGIESSHQDAVYEALDGLTFV